MPLESGEKRRLSQLCNGLNFTASVDFDLPGLDISVFGLDDERQLRDDRYFVFYNQPRSPEGAVQLEQSDGRAVFTFDLARLPDQVSRLVFTATHDERPVAEAARLVWQLADARFDPRPSLRQERAVMIAELYRYGGEWRLGAVGQGFDGGLKALLEYFGGEAEEEAPGAASGPVAPAGLPHAPAEPQTPPGQPVSLRKQQTVNLFKAAGTPLTQVTFGLGWDPAAGGAAIDLDAGCLVFNGDKKNIDKVWFMSLGGQRGAIRHSGDNLTGRGHGDDEQIKVDLEALGPQVQWLVFTINSFSGQRFSQVNNAFCRVVDDASGREIARYALPKAGDVQGLIMAKLERQADGWHMTALGEPGRGMTVMAMVKPAVKLL